METRRQALPTGTVTFFFSDVQESTGLLQRLATGYKDVIERHAAIIRGCLAAHDGTEVSTEGDSFFAVFTNTANALAAAGDIQQQLTAEPWPEGGVVAVRIGLHAGVGELGHDNYIGIDVNRAARISAAGHGGQVVVSNTVQALGPGNSFTDLGDHTLKGITIDLIRLYPKIRDGGWIGGDDFSSTIWQHKTSYEPTLVFPFAVYFAEAVGARIYALPRSQFLLQKRASDAFEFSDLTGRYGDVGLRKQLQPSRLMKLAILEKLPLTKKAARRAKQAILCG